MGLRHVFHVIFIWPILLLLRGVSSPFFALGRLFRWLFYPRRSSITNGTTPDYCDDGSSTSAGGHHNQIPGGRQNDGFFNQQYRPSTSGDNLKFRNRQTPSSLKLLKNEVFPCNNGPGSPSSVDSDPQAFYAINVPHQSIEGTESPQLVFQERVIALKELKKYKGARFKQFSTKEEAINYTNNVSEGFSTPVKNSSQNEDTTGNSPHPLLLEKSNWKNPKGPDLVKLRKAIETGDYQTAQDMINSNPRFLISCGDTPSILQEGSRYNALHVAAKNNQPEIIKLFIQTIEDPSFFLKLYGQCQEDEDSRNVRVMKLLDLYLNTPDKGSCETPLHFACKFGHKDVVEVLMSHPLTEANPKNKFGEIPADLICRRVDKSSERVKNDINEYLQGRRYVPLYRDEDNIVSPVVGTPCCPDIFSPPFVMSQTNPFSPEAQVLSPKSPHDSPTVVKAYAGPMSPSQADNFRKLWRSPCSRNDPVREVVIKDHEKGYERFGRDLALQKNVQWLEHWDFLDRFTDLSKPEGIQLLEAYLQKQTLALNVQSSLEAIQQSTNHLFSPRPASTTDRLQSMKKDLFSDVHNSENTKADINDIESLEGSSSHCSLPAQFPKPSTNQMDVSPPFENGMTQNNQRDNSEQKEPSFREENLEEIMNTLTKEFGTKLIIISPEIPSDDNPTEKPDIKIKKEVNAKMNCLLSLKDEFTDMLSAVHEQGPLSVSFMPPANCDKPTYPCLSPVLLTSALSPSSTTAETTVLTIRSPNKLIAQINALPAKNPPKLRNPLKVFIQGSVPTKSDIDVKRCLKNVCVDSEQFPYTAKWLKLMNSFTEIEQNCWPSPAKGYRNEAKSKYGTPVMKSHAVRQLEPMNLFKSPNTAV